MSSTPASAPPVDDEPEAVECPMCYGTGTLPEDPSYPNATSDNCPECLGAGIV